MRKSTKEILANSLKELLHKKEFRKITISDITNNVNLNRKSFYYHFKDIFELVEWIYINDMVKELNVINTYNNWQESYFFITKYILKNKKFINATYKLSSLNKFIYTQTNSMILEIINKNSLYKDLDIIDKKFIANFYSHAFVGTLGDWIESGMKETPNEIIDKMNIVIERIKKVK